MSGTYDARTLATRALARLVEHGLVTYQLQALFRRPSQLAGVRDTLTGREENDNAFAKCGSFVEKAVDEVS